MLWCVYCVSVWLVGWLVGCLAVTNPVHRSTTHTKFEQILVFCLMVHLSKVILILSAEIIENCCGPFMLGKKVVSLLTVKYFSN